MGNKDLKTRRAFFKEAARKALPIIGAVALMSNSVIAKAVTTETMNCKKSCNVTCEGRCNHACEARCNHVCAVACTHECLATCTHKCFGGCAGSAIDKVQDSTKSIQDTIGCGGNCKLECKGYCIHHCLNTCRYVCYDGCTSCTHVAK